MILFYCRLFVHFCSLLVQNVDDGDCKSSKKLTLIMGDGWPPDIDIKHNILFIYSFSKEI